MPGRVEEIGREDCRLAFILVRFVFRAHLLRSGCSECSSSVFFRGFLRLGALAPGYCCHRNFRETVGAPTDLPTLQLVNLCSKMRPTGLLRRHGGITVPGSISPGKTALLFIYLTINWQAEVGAVLLCLRFLRSDWGQQRIGHFFFLLFFHSRVDTARKSVTRPLWIAFFVFLHGYIFALIWVFLFSVFCRIRTSSPGSESGSWIWRDREFSYLILTALFTVKKSVKWCHQAWIFS